MKPSWKTKKEKRFLILFLILFVLQPNVIMSKITSDLAMKSDQGAEVIVMGEYYDQGAVLLKKDLPEKPGRPPLTRFAVLNVVHVIKGDGRIKPDTLIRILCEGDPRKRFGIDICRQENTSPVLLERGHVVIVYAHRVPDHPGFYSYKAIFPFFESVFFTGPF